MDINDLNMVTRLYLTIVLALVGNVVLAQSNYSVRYQLGLQHQVFGSDDKFGNLVSTPLHLSFFQGVQFTQNKGKAFNTYTFDYYNYFTGFTFPNLRNQIHQEGPNKIYYLGYGRGWNFTYRKWILQPSLGVKSGYFHEAVFLRGLEVPRYYARTEFNQNGDTLLHKETRERTPNIFHVILSPNIAFLRKLNEDFSLAIRTNYNIGLNAFSTSKINYVFENDGVLERNNNVSVLNRGTGVGFSVALEYSFSKSEPKGVNKSLQNKGYFVAATGNLWNYSIERIEENKELLIKDRSNLEVSLALLVGKYTKHKFSPLYSLEFSKYYTGAYRFNSYDELWSIWSGNDIIYLGYGQRLNLSANSTKIKANVSLRLNAGLNGLEIDAPPSRINTSQAPRYVGSSQNEQGVDIARYWIYRDAALIHMRIIPRAEVEYKLSNKWSLAFHMQYIQGLTKLDDTQVAFEFLSPYKEGYYAYVSRGSQFGVGFSLSYSHYSTKDSK